MIKKTKAAKEIPQKKNDSKKATPNIKMIQALLVVQKIFENKDNKKVISDKELIEIIKSEDYMTLQRFQNVLVNGSEEMNLRPLLLKNAEKKGTYTLNKTFLNSINTVLVEAAFYLASYEQLGKLLPKSINFGGEISKVLNYEENFDEKDKIKLRQKFYNFSLVYAKTDDNSFGEITEMVMQALHQEKSIVMEYTNSENVVSSKKIHPYTLVHHRDDLYLLAVDSKNENKLLPRPYKISRIKKIKLDNKFEYPENWSPEIYYKNASGILADPSKTKTAIIKVYGDTIKLFEEKHFFNSKLMSANISATYECKYQDNEVFLGQLFVYAQNIEISEPPDLRDAFIKKAQEALDRNIKVEMKKAS